MAKQRNLGESNRIRKQLVELLEDFEELLKAGKLRKQVIGLIPVNHRLRELGKSLFPADTKSSARDRILAYFREYLGKVIAGDELMIVAGISEYARRIRELRVQFGWKIVSGMTIRQIADDQDEAELGSTDVPKMRPSDYLLIEAEPDRDAAHRWNLANSIRKQEISVQDKLLKFFRENIGKHVSGEELAYLAGNKMEWARRVRELRTEHGWPVVTRQTGNPRLPVGIYVMERDRQAPPHDRKITDFVRVAVLKRDDRRCQHCLGDGSICGWHPDDRDSDDHRFLELHHIKAHAEGGANVVENLITVCNVCHDEIHRDRGDDI